MMRDAYAHTNEPAIADSDARGRVRAHASPVDEVIAHDSIVAMSEVTIIMKNGEGTTRTTFMCEDVHINLEPNDSGPVWFTGSKMMMKAPNRSMTVEFEYPQDIVVTRDDHLTNTTTKEKFGE